MRNRNHPASGRDELYSNVSSLASGLTNGRREGQCQRAGMLSVVKDFDVGDPRILDLLVADTTAGVVVFLISRGIERSDSQAPAPQWVS